MANYLISQHATHAAQQRREIERAREWRDYCKYRLKRGSSWWRAWAIEEECKAAGARVRDVERAHMLSLLRWCQYAEWDLMDDTERADLELRECLTGAQVHRELERLKGALTAALTTPGARLEACELSEEAIVALAPVGRLVYHKVMRGAPSHVK